MHNDNVKSTIRGGQIFLHNMRMMQQVVVRILLVCLFCLIGLNVVYYFFRPVPSYTRNIAVLWVRAKTCAVLGVNKKQKLTLPNGAVYRLSPQEIMASPVVQAQTHHLARTVVSVLAATVGIQCILAIVGLIGLKQYGRWQTKEKHLDGMRRATPSALKKQLKKQGIASDIRLCGVPLVKNSECQHIVFSGTTGAGKSNAMNALLDQVRARGDRAIIVECDAQRLKQYYDPQQDVLLNGLDARSVSWHLWDELDSPSDFDSFAESLIPAATHADPFWVLAAREILSTAARNMATKAPSTKNLLALLLNIGSGELSEYLSGEAAEMFVAEKAEKMALSVKAVLAAHIKCLRAVNDIGPHGFSIRDWIQDEAGSGALFLSARADNQSTLSPLLTLWLDIAIRAMLSLEDRPSRRIWVFIDELSSLNRLQSLALGLRQARKFGGCFVLGWQSMAGIEQCYGASGAREIESLMNTQLVFRQTNGSDAKRLANELGFARIEKAQEGFSYGANTARDGVTISRVQHDKPAVSATEIMALSDLECFLKLKGHLPICTLKYPYVARPDRNAGFVPRQAAPQRTPQARDTSLSGTAHPCPQKASCDKSVDHLIGEGASC